MSETTDARGAGLESLAGRTAIVTGTSRGIGCGIADVLARHDVRLVLTARSAERGEAFAAKLRDAGTDCLFVPADISTEQGAGKVVDAAMQRHGRIDVLVNNAARTRSSAFTDLDEETYHGSFEANVRMIYHVSQPVAKHMAESGGGAIVHISSVGGTRAHRGLAAYDASKGAVDALTRAMAVELAPRNIRVNAVSPGAIAPDGRDDHARERYAERKEYIPLGRAGRSEEIGWAVAFLASDAASYITGQVLQVDGGLTAQLSPPGIFV